MSRKTISRRDAIKLLGAATGAALLANLPSKWTNPSWSVVYCLPMRRPPVLV